MGTRVKGEIGDEAAKKCACYACEDFKVYSLLMEGLGKISNRCVILSRSRYTPDSRMEAEFKWEEARGRKTTGITGPGKIIQGAETEGVGRGKDRF